MGQSIGAISTTGGALTPTDTSLSVVIGPVVSGSAIWVVFEGDGGNPNVSSISDGTNSYSYVNSWSCDGNIVVELWVATNVTAGTYTLTATLSGTYNTNVMGAVEIKGAPPNWYCLTDSECSADDTTIVGSADPTYVGGLDLMEAGVDNATSTAPAFTAQGSATAIRFTGAYADLSVYYEVAVIWMAGTGGTDTVGASYSGGNLAAGLLTISQNPSPPVVGGPLYSGL